MHADIAANSLSTLRYSQDPSSPAFTICERPSTICVCGEIGYAQMTSGRQAATVSATARDPSICLDMRRLPEEGVRGFGGGDVVRRDGAGESLADRGGDRPQRHDAGQRG